MSKAIRDTTGNTISIVDTSGGAAGRKREYTSTLIWICAVLLGIGQAWITRYDMNQDGISYLEIASAYIHHAWSAAISAYWNPLYPWMLASVLTVVQPASDGDFVAAHIANFFIFLLALVCFRFFFAEVLRMNRRLWPTSLLSQVPHWIAELIGCSLFLSCSLDLITLGLVTPDLLVAALVFAATGLVLRMQNGKAGLLSFVLLGVILGSGYLAKSVMLPFFIALVASMAIWRRNAGLPVRGMAVTSLVFALLAGPYIFLISKSKGRFTISDNGRLTYLFVVDKFPYGYPHGVPTVLAEVKHPPKILYSSPAVYEFSRAVPGSCPIWYDTSYWYEGAKASFSASNQLQQLVKNVRTLSRIFCTKEASLCMAVLMVLLAMGSQANFMRNMAAQRMLVLPSLLLVTIVFFFNLEARLIAPFVTVLWLCVLSALAPSTAGSRTWVGALCLAASILLCASVISELVTDMNNSARRVSTEDYHATSVDRLIASRLHAAGIHRSSKIAFVGDSISAYWAHLAGIQIAAEIPVEEEEKFLNADGSNMQGLLAALSKARMAAIIAPTRPATASAGWQVLPGTKLYVYILH